ncbi:bL17 family ribosomal protein [Blastopirellula marina]|uniref:Large ribosomal subunit protein bL17 n=1 Tax=Blastopirellula marina TaxID=124 RepID=A0A2S8GQX8_9BACT|nr:L17 family ribosomal protein [Blastopirellula marina]PQO46434.1 50S ribosomal protein L17 [Blastopirellula marina]
MRHLRKGRRLGRSASHRKALFRNMASSLLLTERPDDVNESYYLYSEYLAADGPGTGHNTPKVKGRIVTTVQKAKELRPYIEKCITVAKGALPHLAAAEEFATTAKPNTPEYKAWRESDQWQQWNAAMAPALAARRRAVAMLGNQRAVEILFDEIAPRFADRPGGYTRILKLAKPRLGDGGSQAILEFVGNERDRVKTEAERPAFESDEETAAAPAAAPAEEAPQEEVAESQADQSPADEGGEETKSEG